MRTLADFAYVAGFFDGEGTITVSKGGHGWMRSVQVPNTNEAIIKWLKRTFGGRTYVKSPSKGHLGKKTIYLWYLRDAIGIGNFLHAILPHLRLKRKDAITLLRNVDGKLSYEDTKKRLRKR